MSARAHTEMMCLVLHSPTHGSRGTGQQSLWDKAFPLLQYRANTFLLRMSKGSCTIWLSAQQQIFPAYSSLSTYILQPLWNLRYNTLLEEAEKSHHSAYFRKFKRCLGNSVLPLAITMGLFPCASPFLLQIYCPVFW